MTSETRAGKLPEPKFGDRIRGNFASEKNPIRDGYYVRTIKRTGRLNPGMFYELTDGKGKFWQFEAKHTTRLGDGPDYPDGCSLEGFVGGCERMGCHEALAASEPVEAVAYCDPSDPINASAFAWPGTSRAVNRQWMPLYTHPAPEQPGKGEAWKCHLTPAECADIDRTRLLCEVASDDLPRQPSDPAEGDAVRSLPALWRTREHGEQTEFDKGYEQASDECADALEAALSTPPTAAVSVDPIAWLVPSHDEDGERLIYTAIDRDIGGRCFPVARIPWVRK